MKKNYSLRINMTKIISLFFLISFQTLKAQDFTMTQTLSDGAQRNTIAFDGLAFLTGNFCSSSFIPPGKVADYFGFQYLRDNDITQMGHTTDFNTVIADNLLYVLDNTQKERIIALAKSQTTIISDYAYGRLPLIQAFIKMRDENGNVQLDKEAIKARSAALYRLDGLISIERAKLYADIIKHLTVSQKHYLDSVKLLGMKNMPVLAEQIDKRPLNNKEFVGAMSIAGDIFSWYIGSIPADVYFCPERQGNYFGGFYIKDAPAMGNHGYAIDTSLTQNGGTRFLNLLTTQQKDLVIGLVDIQRTDLNNLVAIREQISTLLRGYLTSAEIDTTLVLNLSEQYGELDGEISYNYATNFSKVNWSLSSIQRDSLIELRNLDAYPCVGAYLYSDSIGVPDVDINGLLFSTVPVQLINFSAAVINKSVQLNWSIADGTTIDYFIVERSDNGTNWNILDQIYANTNSEIKNYFLQDQLPMNTNYYRIKIVEKGEGIAYSPVKKINVSNAEDGFVFYQNPAKNKLNIYFYQTGNVAIIDILGRKILVSKVTNPGLYTFDISSFQEGVYYTSLQNNLTTTTKLLKVK